MGLLTDDEIDQYLVEYMAKLPIVGVSCFTFESGPILYDEAMRDGIELRMVTDDHELRLFLKPKQVTELVDGLQAATAQRQSV